MSTSALADHYKTLHTEELLSLHQSGKLAEGSYPILESELQARSLSIPNRPPEFSSEHEERHFFTDHWHGMRPLWSAFWLVYVVGSKAIFILLYAIFSLFKGFAPSLGTFALLAITTYLIMAAIIVWRCSKNTSRPVWSWLARGISVMYATLIAYATFLAIRQ